jgi:hypothetical protein
VESRASTVIAHTAGLEAGSTGTLRIALLHLAPVRLDGATKALLRMLEGEVARQGPILRFVPTSHRFDDIKVGERWFDRCQSHVVGSREREGKQ